MSTDFGHIANPFQRAFLAAYSELGTVAAAARAAQINRASHWLWLKEEGAEGDAYRAAFTLAKVMAGDTLETEARRRAVEGWDEPVYGSRGQGMGTAQVGTVRKFSDRLMEKLLTGALPEKYRDKKVEHSGEIAHSILIKNDVL